MKVLSSYKQYTNINILIILGAVTVIEDETIKDLLEDYNEYAYPGTTEKPTVTVTHSMVARRLVSFVSWIPYSRFGVTSFHIYHVVSLFCINIIDSL